MPKLLIVVYDPEIRRFAKSCGFSQPDRWEMDRPSLTRIHPRRPPGGRLREATDRTIAARRLK